MRISELGTILSIWAHPDDETYLAGGLMAAARDNGQRVVCVAASAGELGTSDPATWPPSRLGRTRRREAANAMGILGVDEHHILGLPDAALSEYTREGTDWADQLFAEVRPDTVLTFGPDGMTFHPDHIAVHDWVTRAWRNDGCRAGLLYARPTVAKLERFGAVYEEWNMYMTDERPTGVAYDEAALHRRFDAAQLDRKFAALRAMATQTGDVITALGERVFRELVAEETFVGANA